MKQHTAVRFPPVSGYDIPGLERWLQRMAARGMQFSMTLGPFTLFLPAEPTSLRIHLEPARTKIAEDDPEIIGLYESAGWTHLGDFRKNFYVFATPEPDAQAHTDPQVLSYALRRFFRQKLLGGAGLALLNFLILSFFYSSRFTDPTYLRFYWSSNKITIKNGGVIAPTTADAEYKESGNKIGSVKMADSTVILDLSEVDTKDSYSVVSSLNDGSNYVAYGYDKSKSDNTYRFVIITEGTSSVFNSETQLAIFNGSEVVDNDGDKTAYNLVVNGEEKQFILDDDVVITGNKGETVADNAFDEGDVLVYATNSEGYISRIYSVFAAQNVLNGSSFEDFRTNAFKNQSSVLADTKFADLLSDDDNDVNVVFGPVVDKSGSNITIGTVTTNADGKYVVNYDKGLEVNYSNAKIYTYDFAAGSKKSRVLLDEGIASTPDVKAAKTTVGGQDILNLEHEDVIDDVVFAVVRTTDKDEAQEIYLIVNND